MPKGYQSTLADRLLPWIGYTPAIRTTAEALESAARSYSRIQERWCSEEMSEETTARLERREERLEAAIRDLVLDLPLPTLEDESVGAWGIRFEGDPRGPVVVLVPATDHATAAELHAHRVAVREVWVG